MKIQLYPWIPIALATFACDVDDWGPSKLGLGQQNAQLDQLNKGREVYANYCVGCHGEQGDGKGRAARFLEPKPRDFRVGRLKFAAVSSGEAPRDEDYHQIITHGLAGTSMPNFNLLPEDEKRAVIAYIKTFYTDWHDDQPGAPITVGQDPWLDDPQGDVEAGEEAYHGLAQCWSCHPAYATRARISEIASDNDLPPPSFRPGMYASTVKDSKWGAPIRAPDFLVQRIKTGLDRERMTTVIASGIGGTAMPTWSGSIDNEALWSIAYYVRSLALMRGTAESRALKARLHAQPAPTTTTSTDAEGADDE